MSLHTRPLINEYEAADAHADDVECEQCGDFVGELEPDSQGGLSCLWCRRAIDGVRCADCQMKRLPEELYAGGRCWTCFRQVMRAS